MHVFLRQCDWYITPPAMGSGRPNRDERPGSHGERHRHDDSSKQSNNSDDRRRYETAPPVSTEVTGPTLCSGAGPSGSTSTFPPLPKPPTLEAPPAGKRRQLDDGDDIKRLERRLCDTLDAISESMASSVRENHAELIDRMESLDGKVAGFVSDVSSYQTQLAEALRGDMGHILAAIKMLKAPEKGLPNHLVGPLLDLAKQTVTASEQQ